MSGEQITFETRDDFQRKPIAEKVIRLLEADAQVSPMVIDGGWGTGKTEFCLKLIHLIENGESTLKPIYIDAFKADHTDEPLMTVLSAILKLLPEAERSSLMEAALPVAKFGLKTAMKAGVSWVLKRDAADVAEDFEGDLKNAGDQAINYAVESLLTEHVEAEERIETLKKALASISKESPIVIFIDELDRCRPSFAVSMLESIKHVFDVENVQFVLVTNSTQLRASINHCYGDAVEAHRYLDKFIAFSFRLPESFKPDGYRPVSASAHHLRNLLTKSELLASSLTRDGHLELLDQLIRANQLSLREVETFVQHLELYQVLAVEDFKIQENTLYGYIQLWVYGVFLFCFKPEIVGQLRIGVVDPLVVANTFGKQGLRDASTLQDSWPDSGEVITAIAAFEATKKYNEYIIEEGEATTEWNKIMRAYFDNRGPHGSKVEVIMSAVDVLQLGGK